MTETVANFLFNSLIAYNLIDMAVTVVNNLG